MSQLSSQQFDKQMVLSHPEDHEKVLQQLTRIYCELFNHDGFGDVRIEMRILRRGQKEVIIHSGKQYRYVLDCKQAMADESALKALLKRDLLETRPRNSK